jgi:aminoglycoside phosphotransferase (APT) family kinase protein
MSINSNAEEFFSGTKPVEANHSFDERALAAWMSTNLEDFRGPLEVRQFKGGQSNPTYLLTAQSASYVLRRKPPGRLLASAHAVDREFLIIRALHKANFPVPTPYGLCTDESVIGTAFYVMSMEKGRIFWDGTLAGITPEERYAIYRALTETLAKLHQYDPAELALSDFGRPGNYCERQVKRWIKQYRLSETGRIDAIERLIDWLPRSIPEQNSVSIVHGDYRLNNVMHRPNDPAVLAVLDWELSTLGDPIADFTNLLTNWVIPYDGKATLGGLRLDELGIPTVDEVIQIYCKATGRHSIENLNWYFAYNLFRLAAIMQGIAARAREGTASSPRAFEEGKSAGPLAELGWQYAERAGA